MTCVHLQELFQLCDKHELRLSSAEVIHIVCPQCGLQETCPSVMTSALELKEEAATRAAESDSSTASEQQ